MTEDKHTLVLDAGHGEYMPKLPRDVRMRIVWNPMTSEHLPQDYDRALANLRKRLPDNAQTFEPYDATWCCVVELTGTRAGLEDAFQSLLADVSGEPSGDDDTFDYWPSGARLLLAFARDLDVVGAPSQPLSHATAAERAIDAVIVAKGDLGQELRDKIDVAHWIDPELR